MDKLRTMRIPIKQYLKGFPLLVSIKRDLWKRWKNGNKLFDGSNGITSLNLLHTFPIFSPNSAGKYKKKSLLTILAINQTLPCMSSLATIAGHTQLKVTPITDFPSSNEDLTASLEIKKYFDKYGSDKANLHNYHNFYGPILKKADKIKGVLEIGMGTNNTDVVSNMGKQGKPGASLRAFRDYLQKAKIYGADIDSRILFEEDRIKTFFVDQVDPSSFLKLGSLIPSDLDLIIDDGLHSPNANIATLTFALNKIKIRGWVAIEDIAIEALSAWEVVASLLPDRFAAYMFRARHYFLFAVKRIS